MTLEKTRRLELAQEELRSALSGTAGGNQQPLERPDRLGTLSVPEIGALTVRLGNELHPLGEIFAIDGSSVVGWDPDGCAQILSATGGELVELFESQIDAWIDEYNISIGK